MTLDEILHSYAISQRCLHTLWTAAHDAPGYNKKMWQELSNHLDRITRSAATAAGLPPGNPLVLANEEHVPQLVGNMIRCSCGYTASSDIALAFHMTLMGR